MGSILESCFEAPLRPKMTENGIFLVFRKLLSEKVETIIWDDEAER